MLHWPTSSKAWLAALGFLVMALLHLYWKQFDQASTSLLAALGIFGIGGQVTQAMTATRRGQQVLARDLRDIRENPAMPGTPLTPEDHVERVVTGL